MARGGGRCRCCVNRIWGEEMRMGMGLWVFGDRETGEPERVVCLLDGIRARQMARNFLCADLHGRFGWGGFYFSRMIFENMNCKQFLDERRLLTLHTFLTWEIVVPPGQDS
ncbi:hypothetical protein AAC387_Pa03g3298 [Persea americana]